MSMFTITCPTCGFVGNETDFDMSLSNECWCPKGCEWFELGEDEEEEGDEDE